MNEQDRLKVEHTVYPVPIKIGDYPDPSIVRVGEDYYMTHSSFHYIPGLLIWHSQNLTDWEPVGHAVHEYVGSIMAPDLIYYEGLYYIYFPANDTNWVVTAQDPSGQWSGPVDLQVGLIDPGHAADQEGNRYLYLSDGYVIGLSSDGLSTKGELKKVYEGWRYPSEWRTEGFYLESPKITHRNGYYYMTSAQGGTAGPATSHMIVSARSKTPLGPWENSPYNPIVRTQSREERWWSKGHGTLVDTSEGDWWIVYHAYEKDYLTLGRQTLIEPVDWTVDGWFKSSEIILLRDTSREYVLGSSSHGMKLIDLFEKERLLPHWHFFGGGRLDEYWIKGRSIHITALPPERIKPLLYMPAHHAYEAIVTVSVTGVSQGCLSLFYKPGFECGIGFDGKEIFAYRNTYISERIIFIGDEATLRLVNDHHELVLYFLTESGEWSKLDHSFEMSGYHHNVLGSFLSLQIALNAIGEGSAVFQRFMYSEL